MSAETLLTNTRWTEGPAFLGQSDESWPQRPAGLRELSDDDPEVKSGAQVHVVTLGDREETMDRMLHRYSSWKALKKATAWILRYRSWLVSKIQHRSGQLDKAPTKKEGSLSMRWRLPNKKYWSTSRSEPSKRSWKAWRTDIQARAFIRRRSGVWRSPVHSWWAEDGGHARRCDSGQAPFHVCWSRLFRALLSEAWSQHGEEIWWFVQSILKLSIEWIQVRLFMLWEDSSPEGVHLRR